MKSTTLTTQTTEDTVRQPRSIPGNKTKFSLVLLSTNIIIVGQFSLLPFNFNESTKLNNLMLKLHGSLLPFNLLIKQPNYLYKQKSESFNVSST